MRHFLTPYAVTVLTLCVIKTAVTGTLIAFSGGYQRLLPGCVGAAFAAIDIAPITVAADGDLAVATGTVIEAGSVLHRQLLPMRTGLKRESDKYLLGSCIARTLGCGIGGLSRSIYPVPHLLNGPIHLPDLFPDVTLCG